MHILFNAPGDQPDYATRAIACAHDLDDRAVEFRERWRAKGANFGVTRIGVHAGPALVGNISGSRFFDYAAYGDTINTAARLEAANKFLGTRICVGTVVANAAQDFHGRPIGDLVLRRRCEPLRAYEPLPTAAFRRAATADYAAAFAKLEAGDGDAMPAFAAVVGLHADDPLAGFHQMLPQWGTARRQLFQPCDGCSTVPKASACSDTTNFIPCSSACNRRSYTG